MDGEYAYCKRQSNTRPIDYGRYQLNPSLYAGYDTTPAGQEAAAQAYVDSRYGGSWVTAKNFWLANGWY